MRILPLWMQKKSALGRPTALNNCNTGNYLLRNPTPYTSFTKDNSGESSKFSNKAVPFIDR